MAVHFNTTVGDLFGVAEPSASVIFNEVCFALIATLMTDMCACQTTIRNRERNSKAS